MTIKRRQQFAEEIQAIPPDHDTGRIPFTAPQLNELADHFEALDRERTERIENSTVTKFVEMHANTPDNTVIAGANNVLVTLGDLKQLLEWAK